MPVLSGDGTQSPAFWGYVIAPYLAKMVCSMVDAGRLALVFDLDETLLVANSSSTLETKVCVSMHFHYFITTWPSVMFVHPMRYLATAPGYSKLLAEGPSLCVFVCMCVSMHVYHPTLHALGRGCLCPVRDAPHCGQRSRVCTSMMHATSEVKSVTGLAWCALQCGSPCGCGKVASGTQIWLWKTIELCTSMWLWH